jgi:hypothetical protein
LQVKLDDSARKKGGGPPSFSDPDSREYRDEDARVTSFNAGELAVGEADLERIFNLKPMAPKVPPISIERFSGVKYEGATVFGNGGTRIMDKNGKPARPVQGRPTMGYVFHSPIATSPRGTSVGATGGG